MKKLLISSCLLGVPCRYDGKSKPIPLPKELTDNFALIPVCPEVMGGLPTPRPPAEIVSRSAGAIKVVNSEGVDVTENYNAGAKKALEIAKANGCAYAILKEKSPSCSGGQVYDGTFSRTLTDGDGVTAALLKENGIKVFGESEIELFLIEIVKKM